MNPEGPSCGAIGLRSNQVRDFRRTLGLESANDVLQSAIGVGDALVLAQMLEPGVDQKRFHHPPRFGGVFEYPPGIGAVAAALMAEPFERREERLTIARIDSIFHRDQDRTAIVFDL